MPNCTDIRTYSGVNYHLQTGVDALEFVRRIPDEIFSRVDCLVWDPPYMDPLNADHVERLTTRTRRFNDNAALRFMSRAKRQQILTIIREKMNPDGYLLQFHTIKDELITEGRNCLHLWAKIGPGVLTGSSCPRNYEYINILGPKIPFKAGRLLYEVITDQPLELDCSGSGFPRLVRGCAKPEGLYRELFRHVGATFVLDPFAGYGRSITAALQAGIRIYACDIDPGLEAVWIEHMREVTTPTIDSFFQEVTP